MVLLKILSFMLFINISHSKNYRLSPGQSIEDETKVLKLFFERFHTSKTECAVPGFNCGSGYDPDPVVTPVIKRVWIDSTCEKSPRPKKCELEFRIKQTDSKTYIELEIINSYELCMAEMNKSNRNSCILNITKGPYDGPALNPDNCNLIDELEVRDSCFEALADKLQDSKVCEKMKGEQGFQCIYLRAKQAKDPSICHQLKIGPRVRNEEDRKSAISSCVNTIK